MAPGYMDAVRRKILRNLLILLLFLNYTSTLDEAENPFHFFDRVFAIAMPDKVERIRRVFDSIGVKGDIIDPVRKPQTLDELTKYAEMASPGLRYAHSAGEIAIAMSHRKGLEEFLKDTNARTALIFEDDASPSGIILDVLPCTSHERKNIRS